MAVSQHAKNRLGAAVLLVGTFLVLTVLAVWTPSAQSSGSETSLLQRDGGAFRAGVAERMERFGEQLEREGVVRAGSALIREGEELAAHQDAYGAKNQFPQPVHAVVMSPHLGGTNSAFISQSNGGSNGWALPRRAMGLHARRRRAENGRKREDSWLQDRQAPVEPPFSGEGSLKSVLPPSYHRPNMDKRVPEPHEKPYDGRWWANAVSRRSRLQLQPAESHMEVPEEEGGEDPAQEEFEPYGEKRIATGMPGTYDGYFGSQYKKDAGGHLEAFKKARVNYDDYPVDVYKGVPWMTFDPAVTKTKELNQKIFEPKEVRKPFKLTNGRNKGGYVWPAGWGTWVEGTKGEDRLRSTGVNLDEWPGGMQDGVPLPGWDKDEYDSERRVPLAPARDAAAVLARRRESQKNLEAAGVHLNGFPIDDGKKHAYNNVDGMLDTLVPQDPVPQYRKGGLARQERPFHFLLDEHPNGETHNQADYLQNVWQSGEMDQKPQMQEDAGAGIEYDPSEEEREVEHAEEEEPVEEEQPAEDGLQPAHEDEYEE